MKYLLKNKCEHKYTFSDIGFIVFLISGLSLLFENLFVGQLLIWSAIIFVILDIVIQAYIYKKNISEVNQFPQINYTPNKKDLIGFFGEPILLLLYFVFVLINLPYNIHPMSSSLLVGLIM